MKIYFCGAITGGRKDIGRYRELIRHLRQYGEVLTEHVGDKSITEDGEDRDSRDIYKEDMEKLDSCDVVIAEVTTPSLGVGYEVGKAISLGKPVLCLHRPGKRLSALIEGNPNVMVKNYEEVKDAKKAINTFLI